MAVTIKDVAKETGLALSTISKYINGGLVRDKNRILIEQAIEKLGFVPNHNARALRGYKTYTIGLLIPSLEDGYEALIASRIQETMNKYNYSVVFCCHRDDKIRAARALQFFSDQAVDGVLTNIIPAWADLLDILYKKKIPVVSFEQLLNPLKNDCILIDNAGGAYTAVEHLINQGFHHVATITGNIDNPTARERLVGYCRALHDYSMPVFAPFIYYGDYKVSSGSEGIKTLLLQPNRPDAVFIANYHMCVGAITVLQRMGIRIPDELAVVTFDDMEFSRIVRPNLTSVKQPVDHVVEYICEILI